MRTRPFFARGLAMIPIASMLACSSLTTITVADPIPITAQTPARPLPDLPAVPQPPPPPRVVLQGDVVGIDEALTFNESGELLPDHQDIIEELGAWMWATTEVAVLTIEVQGAGEKSRRKQDKLNKKLAQHVADAIARHNIDPTRLRAASTGTSEDGQVHVTLRVTEWEKIEGSQPEAPR